MNLGEWTVKRALTRPERLFLTEGDLVLDNREFNRRVNRLARALTRLGLGKGDRLAVWMDNGWAYLAIFFAAAKLGVVLVPLGSRLSAPEVGGILMETEPLFLLHGPGPAPEALERVLDGPAAPRGLALGGSGEARSLLTLAGAESDGEPEIPQEVGPGDPMLVMFIPHAGGELVGVVLTHQNLLFVAIHSVLGYPMDYRTRSLVVAPMYQIGALAAAVLPVLYAGGSLILKEFYNPAEILGIIVKEKVNYMFGVPVMYQMLTKTPAWETADLSHVKFFLSGGAPLPLEVINLYRAKGIVFPQGYGMTETGRITSLSLEDVDKKPGSVGKEEFHLFLRLVDDKGGDAPPGEIGEVIVRGPNVFGGYWQRPVLTAKAIKNGWFHTGDLGRRDGDGYLFLEGRKVETIISSGRNIYPAEVERVLTGLPEVAEAAVLGLAHAGRGQEVAAVVVAAPGAGITQEGIQVALKGKVADYKIPHRVFVRKELPRNPIGLVDRAALRNALSQA